MKNQSKINRSFKLNDKTFENIEELLTFSRSISNDIYSFFKAWFDKNEFISVKTSGSTGKPTTVKLKKKFMVNSALATGYYFDLHPGTKALLCLSPNFIAGKMMLVRAMVLGWQLDIVEPDTHPLNKTESNYDFCAMVPLQMNNSLSQLHRIKKLIVGGGQVSNKLKAKLQAISTEVYATYGMTETSTHIAIKLLSGFSSAERVSAPNYKTLPDVQISIDQRGCLIINAPKIADKQIVTNDLVKLISDTEFEWLGRYDAIINSGGVKLIPEQIEEKLSHIIKNRFFVAGIPDEVLGEKLILIVENDKFLETIPNKLRNISNLKKYEMPKEIFYIDQFVETESKKIQRQKTLDLILKK